MIVGTRGSALALAQAGLVAALLGDVEVRVIRTAGDKSDRPIRELEQDAFVGGIEDALRERVVDVAVHSLKDLPTAETPGLVIAAIPEREDPRDAVITADRTGLEGLKRGAVVGTSSPRRAAFIRALRPDVESREIRGNVDTRLRKAGTAGYDAVILAVAGLRRLGVEIGEHEILDVRLSPPAPGQGALAVQVREDDASLIEVVGKLDHAATRRAVTAERRLLHLLGASCLLALGALGRDEGAEVALDAALATERGILRASARGSDSLEAAARVAQTLGAISRV